MDSWIALIDYENTGSLEGIDLTRYKRVIVFTGAKQKGISFPATTLSQDIFLSVRQVPVVAKNNVDFHLVLILGQLSITTPEDTGFHIISRDKGYDGIVSWLQASGRHCRRLAPTVPASSPPQREAEIKVITTWVETILTRSKQSPGNRPVTVVALNNYLKSVTGERPASPLTDRIKRELVRRGAITVYEKTVTWTR
ncbi:PIN domain-containing protein [Klebsiella aerogenes]|uniref:PIN domain-containing protein n=1 Tax=Klebsiella aerogenes TaxID=548 RepID=UPI002EA230C1|nr:hypothetical protein [Klebsiella aerogenes]